jgi:hypothetical protein
LGVARRARAEDPGLSADRGVNACARRFAPLSGEGRPALAARRR